MAHHRERSFAMEKNAWNNLQFTKAAACAARFVIG
jgi:hypothetical protein